MTIRLVTLVFSFLLLALPSFAITVDKSPLVLFDQGHGQRFLIGDTGKLQLSGLSEIIKAAGGTTIANNKELSAQTVSGASAVVISGAFIQQTPEEIENLVSFVEKGGKLAVMLHIGTPLADLLHRFNVDISNAVVHERQNIIDTDINFRVKDLTSTNLFNGVPYFSLYGGWALNPGSKVQSLARTSNQAWVDLDGNKKLSPQDKIDTFSIVVGGTYGLGSFVFFGDDAIFQNNYLDENNRALAANLGKWLIGIQ